MYSTIQHEFTLNESQARFIARLYEEATGAAVLLDTFNPNDIVGLSLNEFKVCLAHYDLGRIYQPVALSCCECGKRPTLVNHGTAYECEGCGNYVERDAANPFLFVYAI